MSNFCVQINTKNLDVKLAEDEQKANKWRDQ